MRQQTARLSEIARPLVLAGDLAELPTLLAQADLRFDAVVGYNALIDAPDKAAAVQMLRPYLTESGHFSLAERIPRHTQRLYQLLELTGVDKALVVRLIQAEEAIYADANDPLVNWDVDDLVKLMEQAGLVVTSQTEEEATELQVTPGVIERWFTPSRTDRPSYADRLATQLNAEEIGRLRTRFEQQLLNQVVQWRGRLVYLTAMPRAKEKRKRSA